MQRECSFYKVEQNTSQERKEAGLIEFSKIYFLIIFFTLSVFN